MIRQDTNSSLSLSLSRLFALSLSLSPAVFLECLFCLTYIYMCVHKQATKCFGGGALGSCALDPTCIYVYVYMYMSVYMYVHVYVYVDVYVYEYVNIQLYVCI
jgi:hypothetical protein